MFEKTDVIAVWIALDDTSKAIVPLEYVVGSHLWGDGRTGLSNESILYYSTKKDFEQWQTIIVVTIYQNLQQYVKV